MKKVVAVLLLVMFIVSGCQGAPDAVEAPPTIEELIADALAHSARGEYCACCTEEVAGYV